MKNLSEVIFMSVKRFFAKHGLITNGMRVNLIGEKFYTLMVGVADLLKENFGEKGEQLLIDLLKKFGEEDGKRLKEELNLGSDLNAAADAWIIMGNIFKVKMFTRKTSDNEIVFYHPNCPMWNFFKSKGKIYCETLCLPYVESVVKSIAPTVEMEIVDPPTIERTCVKKLVVKS